MITYNVYLMIKMATEQEFKWDAEAEGQVEDLYGKDFYYTFHSAEANEEQDEDSYFYFLLENKDETCEVEFTKEQGIELLKAMAKALGAKKLKIEVEF